MKNIFLLLFLSLTFIISAQDHPHPVNPGTSHPLRQHRHVHHHDLRVVPGVRWKFFGGVGLAAYGGNVSGHLLKSEGSILNTSKPRHAVALGVAYKLNDHFMIQTELNYYGIKSVESSISRKAAYRTNNYQFKANNIDFAVMGRFNIIPYQYLIHKRVIPYILAGVGFTTSRPQGYYKGKWEMLSELSNNQIKNEILGIVPVGGGIMYRWNNLLEFALESTIRLTTSGSMDGLVENGISTSNLSDEGKEYFAQYTPAPEGIQKDYSRFRDVYGIVQLRMQYTFVPAHYKHLFYMQDINYQ